MDPAEAVAAYLPGLRVEGVSELGRGLENTAFLVRAERSLVVRYRHEPDPVAIANEARLLERVAEVAPLGVPEIAFFDGECLAYWFVAGRPMEPGDGVDAQKLGQFLEAIQALPVDEMAALVRTDHDPMAQWRDEAAEIFERHRSALTKEQRRNIESFFAEDLPGEADRLVFSHNDLGIEHVLTDGRRITGIIDWSDAAICDPAYDYGLLLRDLAGAAPGVPDEFRERALFYAKVSAIEDFEYGMERGLRWLF